LQPVEASPFLYSAGECTKSVPRCCQRHGPAGDEQSQWLCVGALVCNLVAAAGKLLPLAARAWQAWPPTMVLVLWLAACADVVGLLALACSVLIQLLVHPHAIDDGWLVGEYA